LTSHDDGAAAYDHENTAEATAVAAATSTTNAVAAVTAATKEAANVRVQRLNGNYGIRSSSTLAAASSRDKDIAAQKVTKIEKSKLVGEAIAKKAVALGLSTCVFDRGGFLYHGRIKAVADGAREGGLKF
jgi:ribosomal protein L18